MTIAYDGTCYSGWQIQPNGLSIQQKLQEALKIFLRHETPVTGSGRTDAGTHALGQVAHFKSPQILDSNRFLHSINGILPIDIRIKSIENVPLDFHARYSAKGKIYHYFIHLDPILNPFKRLYSLHEELENMRALALFGDSVTTDHISPAGAFKVDSPAGKYLLSLGVEERDFNSYGSRRGNHHVMVRGTFANVRLRNKIAEGKEGGYTKLMPEGTLMPIFEACEIYNSRKTPLIIFAGKDYGMGSSRDWAAKGTALLGVKAVVARSFERIHRSNLIGMGVLPLEFPDGESYESIDVHGDEIFSIGGFGEQLIPKQEVVLNISKEGKSREVKLISRLDTQSEIEYYRHGGILPFILRQYLTKSQN